MWAYIQTFPKLNHCTELLAMSEELKRAMKAFDMDEEKLGTVDGSLMLVI